MAADSLGKNDVVTTESFAGRCGHGLRMGCNCDRE